MNTLLETSRYILEEDEASFPEMSRYANFDMMETLGHKVFSPDVNFESMDRREEFKKLKPQK